MGIRTGSDDLPPLDSLKKFVVRKETQSTGFVSCILQMPIPRPPRGRRIRSSSSEKSAFATCATDSTVGRLKGLNRTRRFSSKSMILAGCEGGSERMAGPPPPRKIAVVVPYLQGRGSCRGTRPTYRWHTRDNQFLGHIRQLRQFDTVSIQGNHLGMTTRFVARVWFLGMVSLLVLIY